MSSNTRVNPEDDLLRFRTAWLRAIAQAWIDDKFKAKLLQTPEAALSDLGFQWPWQGTVTLQVAEDPKFRWSRPKGDWTWPTVKSPDEWLVLHAPLIPDGISAEAQPAALADYYTGQPTLFGSVDDAPTTRAVLSLTAMKGISPTFVGPDTDFVNFEVALLLVIANQWKKKSTASRLGPKQLKGLLSRYAKKYSIPWALSISVQNDETVHWNQAKRKWENPEPHELHLELPTAPANVVDRTVALAMYNATGAEFPFTCCCA
jgi:ribosomally synthesized peptide (two-chain TOMM family)